MWATLLLFSLAWCASRAFVFGENLRLGVQNFSLCLSSCFERSQVVQGLHYEPSLLKAAVFVRLYAAGMSVECLAP